MCERKLTGGGSVRKAMHEEQRQSVQAVPSGVSKRFAGSFPIVGGLAAAEGDGPRI